MKKKSKETGVGVHFGSSSGGLNFDSSRALLTTAEDEGYVSYLIRSHEHQDDFDSPSNCLTSGVVGWKNMFSPLPKSRMAYSCAPRSQNSRSPRRGF